MECVHTQALDLMRPNPYYRAASEKAKVALARLRAKQAQAHAQAQTWTRAQAQTQAQTWTKAQAQGAVSDPPSAPIPTYPYPATIKYASSPPLPSVRVGSSNSYSYYTQSTQSNVPRYATVGCPAGSGRCPDGSCRFSCAGIYFSGNPFSSQPMERDIRWAPSYGY
jgi:hypothetical protein